MTNDAAPKTAEQQQRYEQNGPVKLLRDAAHRNALRCELTSQFPGADIDAIHHKLGKVKIKEAA